MIALDYCDVKPAEGKGIGLFAKRFIPKGTIIWSECDRCRIIPAGHFSSLSRGEQEKILYFGVTRKDGSVLAIYDEGRFMNHSCSPNILATGYGFDIVVHDIAEGEELTADYRQFYDHIYFQEPLKCACSDSLHTVVFSEKQMDRMAEAWQLRIEEAILLINSVPQPLSHLIFGQMKIKAQLLQH